MQLNIRPISYRAIPRENMAIATLPLQSKLNRISVNVIMSQVKAHFETQNIDF